MTRRKLCFFLFLLAEAFSVESVPFISDHRLLLLLRGGEDEGSSTTNVESKPSFYFGASKPGDGSDEDPDGLPTRFLNMQKGDREKAKEAFSHTVQWRDEHNITTLLEQAHPKFDLCKRVFPVYIPGRDTTNNIVVSFASDYIISRFYFITIVLVFIFSKPFSFLPKKGDSKTGSFEF